MHRSSIVCSLLAAAALSVAGMSGCAGPTKAGQQARLDARDRMTIVNAQIAYEQARRAFETGQLDRALRQVESPIERLEEQRLERRDERAVRSETKTQQGKNDALLAQFHVLRGRILLEQHRLEPALASFDRAIDLWSEGTTTLRVVNDDAERRGTERRGTERRGTERRGTETAGLGGSLYSQAHYFSGIIYQRWSNHLKAYESYREASEADPANVQFLLAASEMLVTLGRYDEAEEAVRARLAFFEHNAAMRHLLAQIALLRNEPGEAVRLLSEARLLSPDDPDLVEELARAQFAAGMYARSYEMLRLHRRMTEGSATLRVANHDAERRGAGVERPDLIQLEARCLVMMDRLAEARSLYLNLTQATPDDVQAWIELGAVAFAIGDHRRLSLSGSRVLALAPERWEGYFLQAMHERAHGGDGGAERSAQLLRQAANRAGGSATLRAANHDAERRDTGTETLFGGSAALPHIMLGRALEEMGDTAAARAAYTHAIRIDPHDRHAQQRLQGLSGSRSLTSVPIE